MTSVETVLLNSSEYLGKKITISGVFVMRLEQTYFVPTKAEREALQHAIFIKVPELRRKLLASVPAYAGSQFWYCDSAEITGHLVSSSEEGFPYMLVEVERFAVFRHGETFVAIE